MLNIFYLLNIYICIYILNICYIFYQNVNMKLNFLIFKIGNIISSHTTFGLKLMFMNITSACSKSPGQFKNLTVKL